MSERNPADILGPVEGALSRVMFPTPVPGQVIPPPEGMENMTGEELDAEWSAVLNTIEETRNKRRANNENT